MGISSSQISRSRRTSSSSYQRQSEISEVTRRIDEKECVFISMQAEIEKAIMEHNKPSMTSLVSEIAAHIVDLNQLKQVNIPSGERGRCQRVIYNFEISLAKLKSILNSDTAAMKKNGPLENSHFYTNTADPDIVSDLIRLDGGESRRSSYSQNRSTLPPLPETQMIHNQPSLSRNNSVSSQKPQNAEGVFSSVEAEFVVLKSHLERSIQDINEYYQMDKEVFFLQVRLKNTEVAQGSALNDRKFELLKQLADFRTVLDRRSGELEEQREITQEVISLELLVDSATEKELEDLKRRSLALQTKIEKSSWDRDSIGKKIELLKRLARILERIAYSVSPATSLRSSVEHLYVNLSSLQEEMNNIRAQEELESLESLDRVLEQQPEYLEENEDDEELYGNIDIIKEQDLKVTPRMQINKNNISDRGTVYVNAEVIKDNSSIHNYSQNESKSQEQIYKRPLPLPRNYDEKIISDLPKHWHRLNEILDSKIISETDKLEVTEIRKHAEVAKNLFERKIKKIAEKFEESVDM